MSLCPFVDEEMMKLTFLGTGSAFTVGDGNYQSNMLLEADSHRKLLIDCGSDARFSIHEQGSFITDLMDIYISHLHSDHIGGLEWVAFHSRYKSGTPYKHCLHLSNQLVDDLWHRSLSASLNPSHDPAIDLSTFFNVNAIHNQMFEWEKIRFHLFQTLHVTCGLWRMPCFGLWFEINGKMIVITSDTQLNLEEMHELYERADLIFQDCETQRHKSGIHAHYEELQLLTDSIKRKMWLYHYQPGPLPDAKKDGFRGFVKKGQSFDLNCHAIFKFEKDV